jgi:hypothetical protein
MKNCATAKLIEASGSLIGQGVFFCGQDNLPRACYGTIFKLFWRAHTAVLMEGDPVFYDRPRGNY